MLAWMRQRDRFPALLLLRRYLKLAWDYADAQSLLHTAVDAWSPVAGHPYDIRHVPTKFPPLPTLALWVYPSQRNALPD